MQTKKDNRDPSLLGRKLLDSADQVRSAYEEPGKPIPLTDVWDIHTSQFLIADYQDCENALERYGDPAEIKAIYATIRVQ